MKEHTKDLNAFQKKVKRDVEKYVKNTYLNLEKQKEAKHSIKGESINER